MMFFTSGIFSVQRLFGYILATYFVSASLSMERVKGIEPSCEAWKASVLPLNYTRAQLPPTLPTALALSIRHSVYARLS